MSIGWRRFHRFGSGSLHSKRDGEKEGNTIQEEPRSSLCLVLRLRCSFLGMSTDQIQIKCPAKPITHAFLQFTDNDERDKFVRSTNMLKKELRERKTRISPAVDAEERFHQRRLGCLKCCFHARHNAPLVQIKISRSTRHVSVDGQIVLRTCTNGSLKYHKYQDIEAEVGTTMEKWMTKKLVATTVRSRTVGIRRRMEGMTTCSQDETKSSSNRATCDGASKKDDKHVENESKSASSSSTEANKTTNETKNDKDTTFIVLQKNVTSLNSSERFEELTQEVEGCKWDAILISETWRASKCRDCETDTNSWALENSRTNTELEFW